VRIDGRGRPEEWVGGIPAVAVVALGLLPAAFALLRAVPRLDPAVGAPTGHFLVVSAVAALALVLALAVVWAVRTLPDARTVLLAVGFLAMAGIFLVHGLGTAPIYPTGAHAAAVQPYPSGYDDEHGVAADAVGAPDPDAAVARARGRLVGFSARLSLVVSALLFALAVVDLHRRVAEVLVRRWLLLAAACIVLLTGYGVVALAFPTLLDGVPVESEALSWTAAGIAWAALAFAGLRFFRAYRLAALPLQGTLALAMGLLAEAQLFMLLGPLWHLSWWGYHLAMLAGFLAAVVGLLRQYRMVGDLGAVVEGLFLRQAVAGLRRGDPRALPMLAAAVSARDGETGAHTERVGELATAVGRRLGLSGEQLEVLRWAGRLHDLGKIGVPAHILRKPGPLTPAEAAVMRQHAVRGWRVALRSGVLARAAPAIRTHHERLDGSGYPDGLRGDAIPLEARIVAVADVWDALTQDRPYRPALSGEEAAAFLLREAGVRLDARCVDALLAEVRPATRAAA
jgi:HD-GYP domain-containing protein (c-di-GMP phosphodiesterase class II)